ncbi:MAG TPA: hypothetical protein VGK50_02095 [Coriobacteriia bacterium]|jgi:hypothetical protein
MTDHYRVLGLDKGASQDDIAIAFEELLAARRSKRQKTSDLHAALAVIGDPTLRRAYDLACFGKAASDTIVQAAVQARELVPDVSVQELVHETWQLTLKAVMLTSGATARVANITAVLSRKLHDAAGRRLALDLADD